MITNKQFFQINKTIAEKNFDIEPDDLRERFCSLFEVLTEEEVDLVIDLTQRYSEISLAQTNILLKQAVQNLGRNPDFQKNKRVVIAPLHILDKNNTVKSSQMIYYFMKGLLARETKVFGQKSVSFVETSNDFFKIINGSSSIVWVDDFIGSGKTAHDLINDNEELLSNVSLQNRFIVALVCHEVGLNTLRPVLNEVCFGEMALKGISSYSKYSSVEKQKYISLMLDIEEKIGVKEDYSLGVGKCEGLISLVRTPNNTFPVYWLSRRKKVRRAPFER